MRYRIRNDRLPYGGNAQPLGNLMLDRIQIISQVECLKCASSSPVELLEATFSSKVFGHL